MKSPSPTPIQIDSNPFDPIDENNGEQLVHIGCNNNPKSSESIVLVRFDPYLINNNEGILGYCNKVSDKGIAFTPQTECPVTGEICPMADQIKPHMVETLNQRIAAVGENIREEERKREECRKALAKI